MPQLTVAAPGRLLVTSFKVLASITVIGVLHINITNCMTASVATRHWTRSTVQSLAPVNGATSAPTRSLCEREMHRPRRRRRRQEHNIVIFILHDHQQQQQQRQRNCHYHRRRKAIQWTRIIGHASMSARACLHRNYHSRLSHAFVTDKWRITTRCSQPINHSITILISITSNIRPTVLNNILYSVL